MFEDSLDSDTDMRNHRIGELFDRLPLEGIMESRLEVIGHSPPGIEEKYIGGLRSIDILGIHSCRLEEIRPLYTDADLFTRLTDRTVEGIFSCFDFASWDRPVQWPISRFLRSFQEEIVGPMSEQDTGKCRKNHEEDMSEILDENCFQKEAKDTSIVGTSLRF